MTWRLSGAKPLPKSVITRSLICSYIDGSMQDCSNSIADTLELLPSCTKQSIWRKRLLKGRYCDDKMVEHPNSVLKLVGLWEHVHAANASSFVEDWVADIVTANGDSLYSHLSSRLDGFVVFYPSAVMIKLQCYIEPYWSYREICNCVAQYVGIFVVWYSLCPINYNDDVIKWKHFPRYWPFVWRIHRSPVNSPHKGQWRGASMFSLICAWTNGWVNTGEAGDLRRHWFR